MFPISLSGIRDKLLCLLSAIQKRLAMKISPLEIYLMYSRFPH